MDHQVDLFMPHMEANIPDSESEGDVKAGDCVDDDIESNCSVYGSTTSNENDTQDEIDFSGDEANNHSDNDHALPDDVDDHDYAGNERDVVIMDENSEVHYQEVHNHVAVGLKKAENSMFIGEDYIDDNNPATQNVYANGEHDYAHDEQGSIIEVLPPYELKIVSPPLVNIVSDNLLDDQGLFKEEVLPFQPCVYFSQACGPHDHHPQELDNESQRGFKRMNEVEVLVNDVKMVRTEDCPPQNIGAEITVRAEEMCVAQLPCEEHFPNMNCLSDDVLLEIFSKLSINTLINIAPVCKRWYELSKHRSLWSSEDVVYGLDPVDEFMRRVRAARYLRTVDVSAMHAVPGEVLLTLLKGAENVRRFFCFCVAHPSVIVELLERYKATLEELTMSISDERLSYGDGGTFKNGVKPRPGYLLKLISEMKNLRVIRFLSTMPSVGYHQGRVNPKWYFGELENPELKLQAIAMKFDNPREILLQKFIIPVLKSKVPFLKELRLSSDILKNTEVQEIIRGCDKLEALVRFPIDSLHALNDCKQQFFIDFILGSWFDFERIEEDLIGYEGLSHIHEVSLRFFDELRHPKFEEFLPLFAGSLHSCKRVHIHRWGRPPHFVGPILKTRGLGKFLFLLRHTLEEIHISDVFRDDYHSLHLIRTIKECIPNMKSRGFAVNRLGIYGLLLSVKSKEDSVIPNTNPLLLEREIELRASKINRQFRDF